MLLLGIIQLSLYLQPVAQTFNQILRNFTIQQIICAEQRSVKLILCFDTSVERMWECFVRSVEPAHLGPLLSHIIVALLPLIPLQPKETAAIIRFLILDNRYGSILRAIAPDSNYFLKCLNRCSGD